MGAPGVYDLRDASERAAIEFGRRLYRSRWESASAFTRLLFI